MVANKDNKQLICTLKLILELESSRLGQDLSNYVKLWFPTLFTLTAKDLLRAPEKLVVALAVEGGADIWGPVGTASLLRKRFLLGGQKKSKTRLLLQTGDTVCVSRYIDLWKYEAAKIRGQSYFPNRKDCMIDYKNALHRLENFYIPLLENHLKPDLLQRKRTLYLPGVDSDFLASPIEQLQWEAIISLDIREHPDYARYRNLPFNTPAVYQVEEEEGEEEKEGEEEEEEEGGEKGEGEKGDLTWPIKKSAVKIISVPNEFVEEEEAEEEEEEEEKEEKEDEKEGEKGEGEGEEGSQSPLSQSLSSISSGEEGKKGRSDKREPFVTPYSEYRYCAPVPFDKIKSRRRLEDLLQLI